MRTAQCKDDLPRDFRDECLQAQEDMWCRKLKCSSRDSGSTRTDKILLWDIMVISLLQYDASRDVEHA